ncbi:CPBP family intramembrane glutamic endopeptidase [Microbacterium sp. 3J1]|uniref:CPBP family intramembrane glutamic endopeptidase n=1 Tax=Microbacterium sp. 3J1 TaxID=861269 RepID=UPI00159EC83A|nr:type II CAAX endopeptidase family protein [Microbacterium sp. 3J1]
MIVYIAIAVFLGDFLSGLADDDQPLLQFVLGHLGALPAGIVILLLYVRWAGNSADVWRERPTPMLRPRRLWLIIIPVLALVVAISNLFDVVWSETSLAMAALIASGTLLVGLGEELAIRGVLLTAVRARHGELATLLVTSFVFGLAHAPGYVISGLPPLLIVVQVFALAAAGAVFYWVRRVSGLLWVGVLLHAFSDWALYMGTATELPSTSIPQDHAASSDTTLVGLLQVALWVALAVSVISVIREDRRNKRQKAVLA